MTTYIEQRLNITSNQKEKIKLAMKNKEAVTIRITDVGDDLIALTNTQINKLNKAFTENKSANIKLSIAQLKYNQDKVEGGFLGALASRALPAIAKNLGIGALTGLASSGVSKLLGSGLYMKRGNNILKVKEFGSGLYLKPKNSNELDSYTDGLYIKKDNQIYEGKGLIGDLVKHIPLLNLIL